MKMDMNIGATMVLYAVIFFAAGWGWGQWWAERNARKERSALESGRMSVSLPVNAEDAAAALEDAQGGDAIPLAEPRTPEAQRTAEICLSEWATARMEAMEAAIGALQREAYTWSKAAETYAKQAQRTPLDPVDVEELWDKANADDAADEVHHAFARLLERAHGIGA